jgi:cytidylate kinase
MLASRLGVPYLDTGAMYRAVALLALRAGLVVPLSDEAGRKVRHLMEQHSIDVSLAEGNSVVLLDGEDVSDQIRTAECSEMASAVSALPAVRKELVAMQRRIGARNGGVIEGRDIGSVVFPDARLKVFLTASPSERARRRHGDLRRVDPAASLQEVRRQQHERDVRDSSRKESPLQVARGAVVVDTDGMTPEEVIARLLDELEHAGDGPLDSSGRNTVRSRNDAS